jgi:flagellar biosynthesis component FlhA
MKSGSANSDAKKGLPPEKQVPASPGKSASKPPKAPKVPKTKKVSEKEQLPALVEFTYTISVIVVILVSLIVAVIGLVTGLSLRDLVIRTGVTTLVIGGLLMLISWQISAGVLKASLAERAEEEEKEKEKEREKAKEQEQLEELQEIKSNSIFEAQ